MTTQGQAAELLERLMADAAVFCDASMRFHGNVASSVIIHAERGIGIFTARHFPEQLKGDSFAEVARLMCTTHNADAVVVASEAWCKTAKLGEVLDPFKALSKCSDRQEAIPDEKTQSRARRRLQAKGISPDSGAMRTQKGTRHEKFNIISPDGLPLTHDAFESKQFAEEFIPKYCVGLREQGYYSAVGERIPLEELPDRLEVVSEAETDEAMDRIMNTDKIEQAVRRWEKKRGIGRGM